jgi:DNA polymerase
MVRLLTLDFETYYDKTNYTLSKMTTEAYVRDPRFEALCLGVIEGKRKIVLTGPDITTWVREQDWSDIIAIAHHAQFDGLILNTHYRARPGLWVDTLHLSRVTRGLNTKHSLAALTEAFDLPQKTVPYDLFANKKYCELSDAVKKELFDGCIHDCELTQELAHKMLPLVSDAEIKLSDITIRLFTEPHLIGDQEKLRQSIKDEQERRAELLKSVNVTPETLRSNDKFTALLESLGVEIEYKQGKNGLIPAFAKTDDFMIMLSSCGDELLESLADARLAFRSTLQLTRSQRMLDMAQRGPLTPYYYRYGATTGRWSGGDALNFQNLPSRGANRALRESVCAPEGHVLICSDASQIECRLLATVAGEWALVQAFREKRDVYCEFSSDLHHRPITPENKTERFIGKTAILQLGYGSGYKKFIRTVAVNSGGKTQLNETEGQAIVRFYRDAHPAICGVRRGRRAEGGLWQKGDWLLEQLAGGGRCELWAPAEAGQPTAASPLLIVDNCKLRLPTGLLLHYDGMYWGEHPNAREFEPAGWLLPKRSGLERMYGAHMIQHVIQALACAVFGEAMLRIQARLDPVDHIVLTTHDDIIVCAPERREDVVRDIVHTEMQRAPEWLPNAPLDAETHVRVTYG